MKLFNSFYNWHYKRLSSELFSYMQDYLPKDSSVLDIGSGTGHLTALIERISSNEVQTIDVIDISKVGPKPKIYDGRNIPFDDKSFDISLLSFILHHESDQAKLLDEVLRVTEKRLIILEDISRDLFDNVLNYWHSLVSKVKYSSAYIQHRSDRYWKELFKRKGFKLVHEEVIPGKVNFTHPSSKKIYVLDI